jgi:WxcM-like, C-terminal
MPNRGLTFVKLQEHSDQRGRMRIVEVDSGLPFVPVRSFIISDVPSGQSRAGHAVSCDELLIVAKGSCLITARTGAGLEEHRLTPETGGVHLRPGTWLMLSEFEPGTILVTYASERYEETRFFDEYVDLERFKPNT